MTRWTIGLGALAAMCVVLCTITWVGFGMLWHTSVVTAYLEPPHRGAGDDRSGTALPVPAEIIPGWVDPGFTTGPLVELLNPDALSAELSAAAVRRRPDRFSRGCRARRRSRSDLPDGFCGRVLPAGVRTVTIPLVDDAPYFRGSVVAVGVLIGDAERLNLRVTDRDGRCRDLSS